MGGVGEGGIPRRKLTLQCSQRFFTELCTFMPRVCCCGRIADAVRLATPVVVVVVVGRRPATRDDPSRSAACDIGRTCCCRCCNREAPRATVCREQADDRRDSARKADARYEVAAIVRFVFYSPLCFFFFLVCPGATR